MPSCRANQDDISQNKCHQNLLFPLKIPNQYQKSCTPNQVLDMPRVMHAKTSPEYVKSHARQNKKTIFRKLKSPTKEGNPTNNWDDNESLVSNILTIANISPEWNKETFRNKATFINIFKRKRHLLARINGVQRLLPASHSQKHIKL